MHASRRGGIGGGHARQTLTLLVPLMAVLIGAGCTGGDGLDGKAVGRVTVGEMVEVASGTGWVAVEAGDQIPAGARVRTGEAEARMAFGADELWLAPQAAAVIADGQIELLRGEALVTSRGDLRSRWTDVEVVGEGVYRLTPGIAPRLGVYSGQVEIRRRRAEVRTVSALREIGLSTRRLPASGQPLTYRRDDPWDRMLLRDAIAFDDEAERLGLGLERLYGTAPKPAEFYAGFARTPERAVSVLATGSDEDARLGPPGETLLQLFMAQSAAGAGSDAVLENLLRDVVELRSAGARWGLVAAELDVTTQDLAQAVDAGQARHMASAERDAGGRDAGMNPRPAATRQGVDAGAGDEAPPPRPAPQPVSAPPAPPAPPVPPPPPPPPPPPAPPPPPESAGGTDAGGHEDAQELQPQPNPTDLLGRRPSKGLVEAVVDLLLDHR